MTTARPQKPPSLEDTYNQNDFLDAKDNQGDWRVGYIINKHPHSKIYKIRFDGWPSKYDEPYKFNSAKLKPFRSIVVGYTGQMQNPGIREWKFSLEDHVERMKSLLGVLSGPEKHSVHDLNQLIRGHNYFYVDFLMTWKFQTVESMTQALQFFFLNIKFLISFLHNIASNFEEFTKIISAPSQPASMSIKQAYFMSFYEIFDCAYIISGSYPRLSNFFRDNGELIKACFKDETKRQSKKTYQVKLIKMFAQQKGIQLISSIINHLQNYEQFVPFLFLQSLTNLYNGLTSLVGTQDKQPLIEKLIKIGESNIKKIKDHHLKDLHKHHVSNFLAAIVNLTVNTNFYENIEVWKIELELELALKMILCPYFERKLKGIAHITNLCEKSIDSSTSKLIKKWINKTNLFQTLFTNNDNQQFIKKSCQLVKMLNIKGYIYDHDIQLIWKARLGKHQTTVKQIYQLISDIPLHQTEYQRKLQLFNKISKVEPMFWDEDYVTMIKKFTENSYGYDIKQYVKYSFGFHIVYKYAVMRQTEFSLELITSLLHKIEKSKIFQAFQEECFKCIANTEKPEIHIRILLIIINNRIIDAFENLTINYISILINFLIKISSQNNEKVVADTLQLLGEIIKSTNKTIQISELMILWNTFTNSTHKELFMKWLYKKRDNGRVIINQALNQEHRSYLLAHLWNTEEEIAAIQQNQTVFLIQLFKTVNTFHQKMKRYNIIIRPFTLQLQHYDKFWKVLKHSSNPKVINLICDFISQVNTSYEQQYLQLSITKLVDNIVSQIKGSIDNQNIEYISKLLILTQKLILRDQEIFNYQSIPKINYIKEYNVVYKDRNEEKTQKFNCMSTLYEFKRLIAEKWSIPIRKLIIYNNKQQVIALESYFKTMNENNFTNNTCEIAEKEEEESFVKNCINRELELFFSLLDDKRIEKAVWNIVQNLPISDQLKFRILQTDDILQELQTVGFYKELYELKVILQLPDEWWQKFSTSRNLQILVDSLNKAKFQSHIEFQYLSTLTDSISKVLNISNSNSIQITIPEDLPKKIMYLLKDFMSNRHSQQSKSLKLQLKLLKNLFSIIESLKIFVGQDYIYTQLLDNPELQQLFTIGLISIKQVQLRKRFNEELKLFISDCKKSNWKKILHLMLKKLLRIVVGFDKKENLKEYFDFTTSFLDKIPQKYLQQFIQSQQGDKLCLQLFQLIQRQTENINKGPNIVLVGYLALLRYLIPYESKELMLNISDYILFQCLFSDRECKCKSKKSRWEALNLLRTLFVNAEIILKVTSHLSKLLKKGKWRTRRLQDWTITLYDKMKSNTGYVGLKNLGCICYMNSFMQQLYMIPNFRSSIISCRDPLFTPTDKQQNLLYQIQKMFLNLHNSDRKFYIPKEFCYAFKDYDGNPTNVSQQMDIDQFSNILFDRVENQLKPTTSQTLIKDMFGGVFSNQIVCKGCPHYSQTQQNFLSISLTVKKNIYQSFDTMIKGDTLDGDNAYFCQRCNKKVSAVKRVSLKKLPDHLIITLKRFQFDYQKMMKLKLNDYCEFPNTLNLQQYSRQYLRKQENTKAIEDEQDEGIQYYNYILKGVVVHIGSADSGHYYSFIQDRVTSKWYEFNDTVVRDFDIEDLPDEAFGGQSSRYDEKQRIKNAYMLIYQREKKRCMNAKKQQILEDNPIRTSILEEIAQQNKQQKIQHALFSPQYSRFVSSTIDNLEQYDQTMQKQILKFTILSYLSISVRQKSQSEVYNKLKKLHSQIKDHQDIKQWVLRLFSQNQIFNEFFKNNLIRDIRRLLAYWLLEIFGECEAESQELFCNLLLNKLTEESQNNLDYCLLLYEVSRLNSKNLDYIVSKNVVGRMIENILRKQPRVYIQKLETVPYSPEELGRQILIERPQTDQSKKLRLDNQNGYIWGIINLAIQRAKQLKIDLEDYISKVQEKYIWLNQNKIYKILQEIRSKLQMYQFLNLLAHLSKGNKQFLQTLIELLNRGLKQFQSKRYRQFFLLFQKLLHISDEYKHIRIGAFQKLIEALMHNQQYTLDSNIIQQWILILINRNEQIRNYLSAQPKIIDYLQKVATKKTPNEQFARKNNTYGQYMINKQHGVKFPKSKKAYTKLAQNISSFYQQILQTKFCQSLKWPYFFQTESTDLKVGDTIAYFDIKDKIDYEQAKIQSISFSRLQLHLKRNRVIQIWKDEQKLSFDTKMIITEEDIDLNSSRTTEMDIDEDELFDDI